MAQACAVLVMARLSEEERKKKALFYFAGIDGVRFKRIVQPGDQIIFECKYLKDRSQICWCEARALVDGKVVCEAKSLMSARKVFEDDETA